MGFLSNLGKKEKTIDELEAEQEKVKLQASIAEQKAMAREMDNRYGKGNWQSMFKGIKSGINWEGVKFTLSKPKK